MKNIAVILAGGRGSRVVSSKISKQLIRLSNGKTILENTMDIFSANPNINFIYIAARPSDVAAINEIASKYDHVQVINGGLERQDSVWNALQAISAIEVENVIIHDACRPFVTHALINNVIELLDSNQAIIPATPIKDTIKKVNNNKVAWTADRTDLWNAQTPQAFKFDCVYNAYKQNKGGQYVDDASVCEAANIDVNIIPGSLLNFKITTDDDLSLAMQITNTAPLSRIGHGIDSHRFIEIIDKKKSEANTIKLGGVDVPYGKAVKAHSDGDVVLHALTDAILGAMSSTDIGDQFPNDDPDNKNRDSAYFVGQALQIANKSNFTIGNIDINIITEKPNLRDFKGQIAQNIANLTHTHVSRIAVKAKTAEQMDDIGKEIGIRCEVSILMHANYSKFGLPI